MCEAPVLLVKTAWGGKSLFKNFRPPKAGGETGEFYTKMLAEVREALDAVPEEFPEPAGRPLVVRGFVWFQGWNDMYDEDARAQYEDNLVHLIDVRAEYNTPRLPVIIGELGNGGPDASDKMLAIRAAQQAAATRPELKGNVKFISTTAFARLKTESPSATAIIGSAMRRVIS